MIWNLLLIHPHRCNKCKKYQGWRFIVDAKLLNAVNGNFCCYYSQMHFAAMEMDLWHLLFFNHVSLIVTGWKVTINQTLVAPTFPTRLPWWGVLSAFLLQPVGQLAWFHFLLTVINFQAFFNNYCCLIWFVETVAISSVQEMGWWDDIDERRRHFCWGVKTNWTSWWPTAVAYHSQWWSTEERDKMQSNSESSSNSLLPKNVIIFTADKALIKGLTIIWWEERN